MEFSVVVPALNEEAAMVALARQVAQWNAQGDCSFELVLVDGGSDDRTRELAGCFANHVLTQTPAGRARQMNAGAQIAKGNVLVFLHADTLLPPDAFAAMRMAIAKGHCWGRFDVRIVGRSLMLIVVATLMNWRSRLTGIATGDQVIFVRRDAFEKVGGFPDQPLMEDIEISRHLRRVARPACIRDKVVTSGRRWDARGVWPTIWLMWSLRWRYWRGESAASLWQRYR